MVVAAWNAKSILEAAKLLAWDQAHHKKMLFEFFVVRLISGYKITVFDHTHIICFAKFTLAKAVNMLLNTGYSKISIPWGAHI